MEESHFSSAKIDVDHLSLTDMTSSNTESGPETISRIRKQMGSHLAARVGRDDRCVFGPARRLARDSPPACHFP
jgi:hypothetical protein